MQIVCVTGTNTDVGKTIATASAIAATQHRRPQCRIGVVKPAQTGLPAVSRSDLGKWEAGDRGDLAVICHLLPDSDLTVAELVRYPEPLAPDLAARRAHMPLYDVGEYVQLIEEIARDVDVAFVEGAGGLLVGLGSDSAGEPVTLLDIAAAATQRWGRGVVSMLLVSQPDLGMLNHCLLTTREIARRGVRGCGIVFGTWPDDPNLPMRLNAAEVTRLTGQSVIGRIPAGVGQGDAVARHSSDWWVELPWLNRRD